MVFVSFQALTALLADDNKFGFIVMDGNGALFGTLSGNTREVLHKFTVDLPKKHGKITLFSIRPLDKSAYKKMNFFFSNPKHMLWVHMFWVLKRTLSLRRFF